jgi:DNA-binding NarL/FixJ family response regulator
MANILIVEDEEMIRTMLYNILNEQHTCHLAETGEQALGYLKVQDYDVVFTDISMPGMSGLELLGHVRQIQPDTPVIVMSGIYDEEYVAGLIKMGAFHFLGKPFNATKIEETVERAVKRRQELQAERIRFNRQQKSSAEPGEDLTELERQLVAAYRERDIGALDRIWADDFIFTNQFGEIRPKALALESLRSEITYEFYITFDVRGNVFGSTAVATGRAIIKGQYNEQDISGEYRYTNTYAKRKDKWQTIASHISQVKQS